MTRAGWAAVIAAVAFPSIALLVVTLSPGPPRLEGFGAGEGPPPHLLGPGGKRGPPPEAVHDEALLSLRDDLELTEEQIQKIRSIGDETRQKRIEARRGVHAQEERLKRLLDRDDVGEQEIEGCLRDLHDALLVRDRIAVLSPLRLKRVLTPAQRGRLLELWREQRVPPPRHLAPTPPDGEAPPLGPPPHGGKGPPPPAGKAPVPYGRELSPP